MTSSKKKPSDRKAIYKLLGFVAPYKFSFLILIILTVLLAAIAPLTPYLIQHTIDVEIANGDAKGLLYMTEILILILVVKSLIRYTHTYLAAWLSQNIIKDIRVNLYKHIIKFKLSFFDKTPIGRLITRCISDIETLSDVFSQGIAAMIADVLTLCFIVVVMFITNWKLAFASLSSLPLLLVATYVFKEKIKVSFTRVRNAVSKLNSFTQEHITGMRIVQIFNAEEREFQKFKSINKEHLQANLKSVLYYSIYFPVAEVVQAIGIGVLVWYFSTEMMESELAPGVIVAFIMYIQMFFRPIRQIADRFNTLQMGVVSTERIMLLLDNDEEIQKQGQHTLKYDELKGKISFQNVSFGYIKEQKVLDDISFEILPGETYAIVGATGAGKSSIISLLNRFYDAGEGTICIDNKDIKDITLTSLRKNIGVVLQDVFLFSDSIRYNIDFGDKEITTEEIKKTASLVGADKFISQLPGQYDFDVKERGISLSVGQRQLLSFVRAMINKPKILILDEATASVDSDTESLIQDAIKTLMKGRTSIVIAHRLSTIENADKIIVMDKGKIVELGTHKELLKNNSFYYTLYKMQFKEVH